MFDERHCTKQDLILITEETDKIKQIISDKDNHSDELNRYLELVARFDIKIANKISRNPKQLNAYIDELIQNIIVDMNEHQ